MSSAILRRNSSREGLQNLLKVTAQRSIEDAEEVDRERRRRARESFRRPSARGPAPGEPSSQQDGESTTSADDGPSDPKPGRSPAVEEDEGFSDWSQRQERRRQQQRMQELSQGAEEEEDEEEEEEKTSGGRRSATNAVNGGAVSEKKNNKLTSSSSSSSARLPERRPRERDDGAEQQARRASERRTEEGAEQARRASERRTAGEEQARREAAREEEEQRKREEERRLSKKKEEDQIPETGVEKRKELKVSCTTSKVLLHQEAKHRDTNGGDAAGRVAGSSCTEAKRATSGRPAVQEPVGAEQVAREAEQLRQRQAEAEREAEQLRQRQAEAERELEDLNQRREERRRVREDEERRREEGEQQRVAREEEEKRRMKGDMERRRSEAAERMKTLGASAGDGEEFSPFSPKGSTHKITVRTESLNRSLRKSNSFKKTQPPVLLPRIDDKLEQYTHAIENSQETRVAKQGLVDIPSSPEAVASKKSLFEAGEACGPTKGTPCKDTEGLKVGVADLITQWVKGTPDGKQSPSRPNDVKPGDVMQKKNMWEIIGDTSGRLGQKGKGTPSGKRYKFIVTGHGKYEKKPVGDGDGDQYSNGKADLCQGDY